MIDQSINSTTTTTTTSSSIASRLILIGLFSDWIPNHVNQWNTRAATVKLFSIEIITIWILNTSFPQKNTYKQTSCEAQTGNK